MREESYMLLFVLLFTAGFTTLLYSKLNPWLSFLTVGFWVSSLYSIHLAVREELKKNEKVRV